MEYYDEISGGYDELYGAEQLRKAEVIARLIRPKMGELLLDVGCGSAIYFPEFRCLKVGIDPSIELLRRADCGEGTFIQARAEQLPFAGSSFDYVISVTAVHNFDDARKGIGEISRVAKRSVVLSILRQTKKMGEIEKAIGEAFTIKKMILEEKDVIFLLEKRVPGPKAGKKKSEK